MVRKLDWPVEDMKKWYLEDEMSLREIGNRLGRDLRMVHHTS